MVNHGLRDEALNVFRSNSVSIHSLECIILPMIHLDWSFVSGPVGRHIRLKENADDESVDKKTALIIESLIRQDGK